MDVKVGDHVKVGGRISQNDHNYGKRGIVSSLRGRAPDSITVKMTDPFIGGATTVNWLDSSCWVLDTGLRYKPLI